MESKSTMFNNLTDKVNNDSKQNNSKKANTITNIITHTDINMKKK